MWISNPKHHNAVTGKMMAEFADAADTLSTWGGAFLVVQGDGGQFCAGADLALVGKEFSSPENVRAMSDVMVRALNQIRTASYVSIAVIEGAAIGGGAEVTTACDFRLMSERAHLEFRQGQFGVSPGWGGSGRLVEIAGPQMALEILIRSATQTPDYWRSIGLVNQLFPEGTSEAAITAWLAESEHVPTVGIRACKESIRASISGGLGTSEEIEAFIEAWAAPERADRMRGARPSKA